jgi:hypothetical protein
MNDGHALRLTTLADADADAPERRVGEVAAVLLVGQASPRPWRVVVGAELEILVDAVGVDDLPRVHLPVRVPDALEAAEGFDELGAVLLLEQLGALLAVAVLAGERAAVGDAEVGGVLEKRAVRRDPLGRPEVEVDPGSGCSPARRGRTSRRGSRTGRTAASGRAGVAGALRRDGGVLPAGPVVSAGGGKGGSAEAPFAQLPQAPLVLAALEQLDLAPGDTVAPGGVDELPRLVVSLLVSPGAELDQQPGRLVAVASREPAQVRRVQVLVHLPVEVVPDTRRGSGSTGGNVAHERLVLPAELVQEPVDLASPPPGHDDPPELLVARLADPEALSVVGDDLERADVVRRAVARARGTAPPECIPQELLPTFPPIVQ